MALLVAEAAKLSREMLERGVIEELIDRDEMFALLPFMKVEGKSYDYRREATLSSGTWLDPYDTVTEGAATFTEVQAKLRILIGDVDLDEFLLETQSDHNDQLAIQIAAKVKALGRTLRDTLVNGSNADNAKEPDGLKVFTPSGQTLVAGANGAAVNLEMIDELKDTVKNGADALMMRQGTWRAIKSLLRAAGGNDATTMMVENFGRPIPALDGTPVIINDWITGDDTQGTNDDTCSIYALRMNEADGLHGIYGGDAAGFRVESIGTIQTKDAVRYRVKWYVGLALKATHSVARLKGVTNI